MQKTKMFKSVQTLKQFQENESIESEINNFVTNLNIESFVIDSHNITVIEENSLNKKKLILSTAIIRYDLP